MTLIELLRHEYEGLLHLDMDEHPDIKGCYWDSKLNRWHKPLPVEIHEIPDT
jgi:hypothetical protein